MKRLLLLIVTLFASNLLFGQLVLEKTLAVDDYYGNYESSCQIGYLPDYGYVIYQNEYVRGYNDQSQTSTLLKNRILIYDLSYSLIKEINLMSLGECPLVGFKNENKKMNVAVSQYLFNQDSKIEFAVLNGNNIQVYNEDLTLIQEFIATSGSGLEWIELIMLNTNSTTTFKLKVGRYDQFQFYSVPWDPFVTPTSAKSANLNSVQELFKIYPNPVENELKVVLANSINGIIVITDLNGKKLKQVEVTSSSDEQLIDIKGLTNGMYFCQLITDKDQRQTVKFLKED